MMEKSPHLRPVASGDLERTPLPVVLFALYKRRFTGHVGEHEGGRISKIYLREGTPVAAFLPTQAEHLGRVLLEIGLINQAVYEESLRILEEKGRRLGDILKEMGAITEEQLTQALKLQLRRKLDRLFAIEKGWFEIYAEDHAFGRGDEARQMRVHPRRIIYSGIRSNYTSSRLEREAKELEQWAVQLAPGILSSIEKYSFIADDLRIVDCIKDRPLGTQALCQMSGRSRRDVLVVLYTLWVTEALVVVPREGHDRVQPGKQVLAEENRRAEWSLGDTVGQRESSPVPGVEAYAAGEVSITHGLRGSLPIPEAEVARPRGTPEYQDLGLRGEQYTSSSAPPDESSSIGGAPPSPGTPPVMRPRLKQPIIEVVAPVGVGKQGPREPQLTQSGVSMGGERSEGPASSSGGAAEEPQHPRQENVTTPSGKRSVSTPSSPKFAAEPTRPTSPGGLGVATPSSVREPSSSASGERTGSALLEKLKAEIEARFAGIETQNLFEVLGVPPTATKQEIRAAYLELAKLFHPDRVPAAVDRALREKMERIFARITEAHATLTDDETRKKYEASLREGKEGGATKVQRVLEAELAFQKGLVFLRKKDFANALAEFKQAVSLNPDEADHHALLGWTLWQASQDKARVAAEAKAALQKAISLERRCQRAYLYLGEILLAENALPQALGYFQRVLDLSPDNLEAQRAVRLIQTRLEKESKKSGFFDKFRKK